MLKVIQISILTFSLFFSGCATVSQTAEVLPPKETDKEAGCRVGLYESQRAAENLRRNLPGVDIKRRTEACYEVDKGKRIIYISSVEMKDDNHEGEIGGMHLLLKTADGWVLEDGELFYGVQDGKLIKEGTGAEAETENDKNLM